uniref:Nucleosome assembly protein 1-like 1 n=2 Tax=Mesocestoides corti TaxID=53468 RepID=A0A5K3EMY1_MESCO
MVDGIKEVNEGGDDISASGDSEFDNLGHMEKFQALAQYMNLPVFVKRRVKALKKLLHDYVKIEMEFYKEIFEVEQRYQSRYIDLWNKRQAIVSGESEPTDEECEWPFDGEVQLVDAFSRQHLEGQDNSTADEVVDEKGIPKFWLKVLLHSSLTAEMVGDNDQAILEHLCDIKVNLTTEGQETGFTLEFHFSPNEYFTNTVLTKQYVFNNQPPAENPLEYDGPEIVRCRGCAINWKPGKNITIKIMKKIKKHKNRKEVRTVTKTVKQDSFFNFFDPPLDSLTDDDLDEDTVELLQEDFRIGHFIRETLIPRAVLYFTGEAVDSDDESDEESDDDDGDDDDDDVDDSDRGRPKRGGRSDAKEPNLSEKPECQQS